MNSPLFRKNLLPLALLLAASVCLLLPAAGLSSGEIPLNKGAVLQITDFGDSSTAGPDPSLFSRKYSGAAKSDPSLKTLRAMAKASPEAKASYWARMGIRFSILKGKDGSIYGKARISLYGLSFYGAVITPQAAAGKASLKMTVSNAEKNTGFIQGRCRAIPGCRSGCGIFFGIFINSFTRPLPIRGKTNPITDSQYQIHVFRDKQFSIYSGKDR